MTTPITAAPTVQSTEFDYSTVSGQIAAHLDNSKDFYQASKLAYLAVKDGAVQSTLAKSITSSLKAKTRRNSTIKSIAPATLGYRVAAYRFIVENNLPESADTVNDTYTLVSKTSGVRPGLSFLPEILKDFRALSAGKQNTPALLKLIEAANEAAKPSAKPRVKAVQSTEPETDETPDVIVAKPMTADEAMALIRAISTDKRWNATDRKAIKAVMAAGVTALNR